MRQNKCFQPARIILSADRRRISTKKKINKIKKRKKKEERERERREKNKIIIRKKKKNRGKKSKNKISFIFLPVGKMFPTVPEGTAIKLSILTLKIAGSGSMRIAHG